MSVLLYETVVSSILVTIDVANTLNTTVRNEQQSRDEA